MKFIFFSFPHTPTLGVVTEIHTIHLTPYVKSVFSLSNSNKGPPLV